MARKILNSNELVVTGVDPRNDTGNIFNVPLSDHRITEAGIDPNDLLGRGITEQELQRRMQSRK